MPSKLLDTSTLAPREREAATREFLETLTELDVIGHACPPESIRTSIHGWDLNKFQLIVADSPWLHFGLNRRSTTEAVSFGVQLSGQTIKTVGEHCQAFSTWRDQPYRLLEPVPVAVRRGLHHHVPAVHLRGTVPARRGDPLGRRRPGDESAVRAVPDPRSAAPPPARGRHPRVSRRVARLRDPGARQGRRRDRRP